MVIPACSCSTSRRRLYLLLLLLGLGWVLQPSVQAEPIKTTPAVVPAAVPAADLAMQPLALPDPQAAPSKQRPVQGPALPPGAQVPEPRPPVNPPAEAVMMALADLMRLPKGEHLLVRYIWMPEPTPENYAAAVWLYNAVLSKNASNVIPFGVEESGYRLIRVNLRQLTPADADLATFIAIWDSLAVFDPYFHLVIEDPVAVNSAKDKPASTTEVAEAKAAEAGKARPPQEVNKVAQHGRNLDKGAIDQLAQLTGSAAPIYRFDWLLWMSGTAVDNGKYYDWIGAKGKNQQEYLLSRGASAEQLTNLQAESRAAILMSAVTGKPRRIDVFRAGNGAPPTAGQGLVSITHDPVNRDVPDARFDPFENLLRFNDRGREVILERQNGWHEYTLFNSEGVLVAEAPPDLVADHLIPAPYTKQLQAASSCINCHGSDEGLKPFNNDVLTIYSQTFVAPVADLRFKHKNQFEQIQDLRRLYAGNLTKLLQRSRDDFDELVGAAIRALPPALQLQPDKEFSLVRPVYLATANCMNRYAYTKVDPALACQELGIWAGDNPQLPFQAAISPEAILPNHILAVFAAGLAIPRAKFEVSYQYLATRLSPPPIMVGPDGPPPN